MSVRDMALGGVWGANLLAICATNLNEIRHCLAVLILLCVWTANSLEKGGSPLTDGCAARAAVRMVCAETLVFWALYWGMVFEILPLHMRV